MKTSAALYLVKRNPILSCILQYNHCNFVTIRFRLLAGLFVNLARVHKSTFLQICIHFLTCRTSTLEDADFHRMNWCKFILGNPYRAIETLYHWDFLLGFGSRRISLILLHEITRRRI